MSYDVYRLHTPPETEGTTESDYPVHGEVPYCEHWQTVWKVSDGHEPSTILGYKQLSMQDLMGESSIQSSGEGAQGIDASDWWEWNCGF